MILSMAQIIGVRLLSAATPSVAPFYLIDGVSALNPDIQTFISKFTTVSISLSVVVAVVLIAVAGYTMVSSQGDPNAIKDATDQIQNAIMGFVLILAAVTVIRIIFTALGIAGLVF